MLLSDLQRASFRGAPFKVPRDRVQEGRNAIHHEYPDASFRYVEDNGYIPPKFCINALLHGLNLPSQLSRLRAALNRPGPGVLKHPYYGVQFVQVDGEYEITRDDREAGTIELEIKFAVTGPPILPGLVSGVAAVVSGLASSATSAIFDAFLAAYGKPSGRQSLSAVAGVLGAVGSVLDQHFGGASNAPARLVTKAETFAREPSRAIPVLVDAFRAPFDDDTITSRNLARGFKAVRAAAAEQWDVADAIVPSTPDLALRASMAKLLASALEAAAFVNLADAMASTSYTTSDEVEDDEVEMTAAFESVQSREHDADIHTSMVKLHVAAASVLQRVAVRLPYVSTVEFKAPMPASILNYMLYESDTNLIPIVELNLDKDPVLMPQSAIVLATR